MPVSFTGPILLRRDMSLQIWRQHTHPQWPSGNATERQRSPKAMEASWESIPKICRPRKGRGAGLLRSWKQSGSQLGPAAALWPGSQKYESMVHPRRRDAERGGSRPRMRTESTTNPRWDLACFSRVVRWSLRIESRLGLRGVLMRKQRIASTAWSVNSKRKRQSSSRYPAHSSLGICIGYSSKLRRPISRMGRSRQSSAAYARIRISKTSKSSKGTVRPRRGTHL